MMLGTHTPGVEATKQPQGFFPMAEQLPDAALLEAPPRVSPKRRVARVSYSMFADLKSQPLALQNLQLGPISKPLPVAPSSPFSCQFSQAKLTVLKSPLALPKSPP